MNKTPKLVIAGTHSGCGKTTITLAIIAALVRKGTRISTFKAGPDYIDPMFHTFITGKPTRNLDPWMLEEETVKGLFVKNTKGSELALIEGVMGLYDGFGGYSKEGSTAQLAGILKAPVILVVDARGASLSLSALVKGFMDFDSQVDIKGIILNNIKTESHFKLLKETLEENTGISVLGYLRKIDEISLDSRHLGLVPAMEYNCLKQKLDRLAEEITKTLDMECLLKIAREAEGIKGSLPEIPVPGAGPGFRLGVAMDSAFNFYYRDNLDLLEKAGGELVFFSPIEDREPPHGIDGLYIGGGYPEVFAGQLENNLPMREGIKRLIDKGIPAYAECGGLMYLTQSIETLEAKKYMMAGAIPGKSRITNSLKRFGYVEVDALMDSVILKKGARVKAHEFHYSITEVHEEIPFGYKVIKSRRGQEVKSWNCGFRIKNLCAGYPHINFWSRPEIAARFARACKCYNSETR